MIKINQEQIQSLFNYRDGNLYWKKRNGNKAGTLRKDGYYHITIDSKKYLLHRLIFLYYYSYLPKFIDHIDNNKLNNQIENLREVTKQQNNINVKPRKGTSSQYKGVSWSKISKKWLVHIRISGKPKHLGLFKSEIDAAKAYNDAAIKYFREYAYLNEII